MKGQATILAVMLLITSFLLAGCLVLEEDEKADELPTRGYGSMKLRVDDVGPASERSETGLTTGRRGFLFDFDHNGTADYFYQIRRPSATVTGFSIDSEGFVNGGLPVAVAKLQPGQEDYEVPLDSLTSWIKTDRVVGYKAAQYQDEPDVLVYENRIFDREEEAALTGTRKTQTFRFVSVGTFDMSGSANVKFNFDEDGVPIVEDDAEPPSYDDPLDDQPDFTRASIDDVDTRCNDWVPYCERLESCGEWGSDWSTDDCSNTLYFYTKAPAGQRFLRCVQTECIPDNPNADGAWMGCDDLVACRNGCYFDNFADAFGCDGQFGPEARDVMMFVERDGEVFPVEPGYTVQAGEKLSIFIDYQDVEGNFANGAIGVQGAGKLVVPSGLGRNSWADRTFIGFTVASPLPKGEYTAVIRMQDDLENGCSKEGPPFPVRFASAGTNEVDNAATEPSPRAMEWYEIYAPNIDKYNVGQGFVDINAIEQLQDDQFDFLYKLPTVELFIIQASFFTFTGVDNFELLDYDALNQSIFGSVEDLGPDKFDPYDDLQPIMFYISEPMSSGLFTFYGDLGWNIYPVGPGSSENSQPFIRGDFETTRLHIPFTPFYTVNPKYTGCANNCEYWINELYTDEEDLSIPGFGRGEEGRVAALEHCERFSGSEYWIEALGCIKRGSDGDLGCVTASSCLGSLGEAPSQGPQMCQKFQNIPLNVTVNIPPEYLAGANLRGRLINETGDPNWKPLQIGLIGLVSETQGNVVPGSSVDLDYTQSEYSVPLPYMPHVPDRFFQIATPEDSKQSQLYIAIFDGDTGEIFGGGFYSPNATYEDDTWMWLMIYSYNWVGGDMEGWTLGVISGNSIYDFVNPFEHEIVLEFGDLRFSDGGRLRP
jgi:hypothetical protein